MATIWRSGEIEPGKNKQEEWERRIEEANLILALISIDFMTAYGEIIERLHKDKRLIPIWGRPCSKEILKDKQGLPRNGGVLSENLEQKESLLVEIADEIRRRLARLETGEMDIAKAKDLGRYLDPYIGQATELGRKVGQAISLKRGQLDTALTWLRKAMATLRDVGDLRGVADCLRAQARVKFCADSLAEADALLRQALDHYQEVKDRRAQALCLSCLGRILVEQGKLDDARDSFKQALSIIEKMRSFHSMEKIHNALAKIADTDEERGLHMRKAADAQARRNLSLTQASVSQ